jgi:hypothetical protein
VTESLTACVIARDEEQRLPACLASLGFCDEVVVVDSGSGDRTIEIAREAGAVVVENPWRGFAAQRNVALDRAGSEWVLEIDADERVSPELAAEIHDLLADPPAELRMAALPMRDLFLGRALGASSRYPRYRLRLFRRGAFRHDESRAVHEGLWSDGPVLPLRGELRHLLAGSLREAIRDAAAYARLEAAQRARAGGREAVLGIFARPAVKFAYRLLLYGGWRDGWQGLTKIALECGADSVATIHRLGNDAAAGAPGGFGQEPPHVGPVRIVGVAAGRRAAAKLEPWLAEAAAAGADVSLIAPSAGGDGGARRRLLERATPGAMVRALDAEEQVRPIDALLLAGRRERFLTGFAPGALKGAGEPLDRRESAAAATGALRERAREQEAT